MGYKNRAKQLMIELPAVFLAVKDRRTPLGAKVLGVMAVGYALSPVDLIPDFIPVLGYLDDIVLVPLLVAAAVKLIPKEIMAECRVAARGMWENGKPKRWFYAVPVVLLWAIVLGLAIKVIWF